MANSFFLKTAYISGLKNLTLITEEFLSKTELKMSSYPRGFSYLSRFLKIFTSLASLINRL